MQAPRYLVDFLRAMEGLELKHEASWVLDEMKNLSLFEYEQENYLQDVLKRRKEGEPLAYIFGHWAFRELELAVGPGVLIPRPETEELVEHVRAIVKKDLKAFENCHIIDAGAGSGCLGLGLISELLKFGLNAEVTFIENSQVALPYLKKNVANFAEQTKTPLNKLKIFESSWSSWNTTQSVQILVSNPPYISGTREDNADKDVQKYEPSEALYPKDLEKFPDASGPYRELMSLAQKIVGLHGILAFELGTSQSQWIAPFTEQNYAQWKGRMIKDMASKDRFWIMQRIENG